MKIVARDPGLFYARPTSGWISTAEESPRRRYKVEIPAHGIVRDFMNVQIIDSHADVFPDFAAVEASDNPSVFNREIKITGIVTVDMDISRVTFMLWLW